MTNPPQLTDRAALDRNRSRAIASADFLHREAIVEIKERLREVNKRFTAPAIVTGFAHIWRTALPTAAVVADSDVLPLKPNVHDLVVHGLALHWSNDPVGQLVQCRRALTPDGLFLGVLFGGQTLAELRAAFAEAEARVSGGISPRVLPMSEIRDLGGLLQRAGFSLPVADSLRLSVRYASPWHLMRELRAMGETNALSARLRRPTQKTVMTETARIYSETFGGAEGSVPATFELIFLTGWAPDASQQRPLRPGSAKTRLSDALGASEFKLPGAPDD